MRKDLCYYPDWEGGLEVGRHHYDKTGYCNTCGKFDLGHIGDDHHEAARAIDATLADYVFAAGHLARGLEEFDENWQNLKSVNGHLFNEITGDEPGFFETEQKV